jgi:multicomponent Na+:H+ antiporter subunit D
LNPFLLLPLLTPFGTAIFCLLSSGNRRLQRGISLAGAVLLFVFGFILLATVWGEGIQSAQMGDWEAPFGITLVADLLSAVMVSLAGMMGLAVTFYSLFSIDEDREHYGYHALIHLLLMGVVGAFITGDMFNMFVWFEVLLISSFVLLALGGEARQVEGGIKYVTLNLLSSAFFLSALGLLYAVAGTLNMAQLALRLEEINAPGLVTLVSVMFMMSFSIKAAMFPLFFWLPASYHTPPVVVSAFFAGLLTKVGVYSLIRVFTLMFVQDPAYTHGKLLLGLAGLTMVSGILGAAAQKEVRRILAFNIVSHIGYMVMGLALFTPLALAGAVFYTAHHIVVITNLYLVAGVMNGLGGGYEIRDMGSLYRHYPLLGLLFLIPALSLAGVPPLSGFWAKFVLIRAGLELGEYAIVIAALAVGFLTVYSMIQIWGEAFWKDSPAPLPALTANARWNIRAQMIPVAILALVTVGMGLGAEPVYQVLERAATDLMDRNAYISAVLGDTMDAVGMVGQ